VQRAEFITGETKKHWNWVVAALVLLAVSDFTILLAEHHAWETIEREPPKADVTVGVTGRQWNWIFTYPGPDGKLNTSDDVVVDALNSELHVPVNKNIIVELRATDVLHSFFIPNARLKQDVIPGRTGKKWFNVTKLGKYDIACAEICGIMHAKMRNFLVVETQEQYDQYIKELYAKNAK
jgi:cytochrome c oxidase subunit 2